MQRPEADLGADRRSQSARAARQAALSLSCCAGAAQSRLSQRPERALIAAGATQRRTGKGPTMSHGHNSKEFHGRSAGTSRRRALELGSLGFAAMLAPAPWRAAFGQAKPYKIGTTQPLSGTAASGGKTALVGIQMAVDRINKAGGINGRPVELIVADDEGKPDVGRRKAEKLAVEDNIDAHVGGFLSNICLACTPVWDEHKIVNMITVCLDPTLTTSKCNRYSFRPVDYAPAQAVAFAPYLVNNLGRKWHIAYTDYAWGQSTRDAYAEQIKKLGGEMVGSTGIPL